MTPEAEASIGTVASLLEEIKRRMIDGTPLDIGIAFEIGDALRGLEALQGGSRDAQSSEGPEVSQGGSRDAQSSEVSQSGARLLAEISAARDAASVPGMDLSAGSETVEGHGRRLI